MPPVTAIFAREQNLYLGKGSVPINIDFFLGLWNRTKYVYDSASRLKTLTHSQGATVLADYTFDYNTANRLETFTSTKDAAEGFSQGEATYAYDSAGQLTGTAYLNWDNAPTESYNYDNNGNRANTGYATGDDNQLASDGTSTYEYDHEGNRTAKNSTGGLDRVEYKWDYRNRLEKVTFLHRADTGTAWTSATVLKVVNYTYDEFDRLVHKQVEDFVTETVKQEAYVHDGQDMVLKFARGDENALVASDLQTRYLHGPAVDQILAEESVSSLSTAGNVYWMLGDHEGTIRDVADYNSVTETTSVVNHLQYASFGEIRGQDGTYTPTFTYTGRQYDADSELYYYRARWYDAKVGKFISKDPIEFNAGDANLYRYCGNGPTNFIDPSGLQSLGPGQQGMGLTASYSSQWEIDDNKKAVTPAQIAEMKSHCGGNAAALKDLDILLDVKAHTRQEYDPNHNGWCGTWVYNFMTKLSERKISVLKVKPVHATQGNPGLRAGLGMVVSQPINWWWGDGFKPSLPGHFAIQIVFPDGSKVYFDNGWTGNKGIFGKGTEIKPSLVPLNPWVPLVPGEY